jgi:rubrerythrin
MEIYPFASYQIAELAMQLEEEGQKFYLQVADKVDDKTVKEVFIFLAQQEAVHKTHFSQIAERLKEKDTPDRYLLDIYENMKSALSAAKNHIFNILTTTENNIDISKSLEIAMQAEKEAIKFYSEISLMVLEKYKEVIKKIIDEEKQHLILLVNVQKKANQS